MRRRFPLAVATLAAGVVAAPALAGPPEQILVGDDYFNPDAHSGSIFEDVHWTPDDDAFNDHNVVQDRKLFDSDELTTTIDYTITPSAGTFPYYCENHGGRGGVRMAGTLRVPPISPLSRRAGKETLSVQWGTAGSETGNRYDVRYKGPGTKGKYKSWLKRTAEKDGEFGEGNEPANVKPGKTYAFQARSRESDQPKRKSKWSPKLEIET